MKPSSSTFNLDILQGIEIMFFFLLGEWEIVGQGNKKHQLHPPRQCEPTGTEHAHMIISRNNRRACINSGPRYSRVRLFPLTLPIAASRPWRIASQQCTTRFFLVQGKRRDGPSVATCSSFFFFFFLSFAFRFLFARSDPTEFSVLLGHDGFREILEC